MRVLISTIYEGNAVKVAISKLSPDKIILLVDEPKKSKGKRILRDSVTELKKFYSNLLEIEIIKIKAYEMEQIMQEVARTIDRESKKENEIIIHLTEGRKTGSLALLFAAYLKRDKVKAAYYITEEEHKLISLPIINLSLGESKKRILKEIDNGNGDIKELEHKLKIKQSATYQHLQELKKEGYLQHNGNKEVELTNLGRLMIL